MAHWLRDPVRGSPCTIIGEVAQAHDGSLGMAHAFVDAIARAGADAVKFQTHFAEAESTPQEPWRRHFSPQDQTRFDYWRRTEFTEDQWAGLKRHAEEAGLLFLSSPFSPRAFEVLSRMGVGGWKVASGEITNLPVLEQMARTGRPVMLSTGMSDLPEIDAAVALVRRHAAPLAVLQCTSLYPCPPEAVGLNALALFRERYGCAVGLSDHSAKVFPGLAAVTLGIEVLEVHVTLSREMFGPDVGVSLTTSELSQLIEGVRFIERMRAHPVDRQVVAPDIVPMRSIFMKSIVARLDLPAGTILCAEHLALKKPGTGMVPADMDRLLGRRLRRDVPRHSFLSLDDVESTV